MRAWLTRLLARPREIEREASPSQSDFAPSWAADLEERMRTIARAQSKLSLRLDELSRSLAEPGPDDGGPDPAPVLDALDRLDEARRTAADQPALERGLEGIVARLEGFLGAMGVERRAELGVPVNPKLFRVVGVQGVPEGRDGVVVRVVRAAAVRGERVIREGEVLIGRGST